MSELRKDPTGEKWVIVATKRKERPFDFLHPKEEKPCSFCPGNEHLTPPESFSYRQENTVADSPGWRIRVVPNLFPALVREADFSAEKDLYMRAPALGGQEVIIEVPEHKMSFSEMGRGRVKEVIQAYQERFKFWSTEINIKYVLIFKNYGKTAGASLEHPHSQLMALSIVPPRVEEELRESQLFYDRNEKCLFCAMLERELKERRRLVLESKRFVVFCPFASRFPYEVVLLPKEHQNCFVELDDKSREELAEVVIALFKKLETKLDDPPYNYLIHSSPVVFDHLHYHWHLELTPRLATAAGFEWGTGIFINMVSPEEAAKVLREDQDI